MVINVVKKPVEVQAVQWDGTRDGFKEIQEFAGPVVKYMDLGFSHVIAVHTLEGTTVLRKGDFLVKGVKDEFYPVSKEIFWQTYDYSEQE